MRPQYRISYFSMPEIIQCGFAVEREYRDLAGGLAHKRGVGKHEDFHETIGIHIPAEHFRDSKKDICI